MHAVIKSGGKQYRVAAGDKLNLETLAGDVGSEVRFDQVLMVGEGDDVAIGKPFVDGAAVTARVLEHGRGDKIRVIKFKRRKHYKRTMGHRQNYTRVEITDIQKG